MKASSFKFFEQLPWRRLLITLTLLIFINGYFLSCFESSGDPLYGETFTLTEARSCFLFRVPFLGKGISGFAKFAFSWAGSLAWLAMWASAVIGAVVGVKGSSVLFLVLYILTFLINYYLISCLLFYLFSLIKKVIRKASKLCKS